jgi:hypothetical protein
MKRPIPLLITLSISLLFWQDALAQEPGLKGGDSQNRGEIISIVICILCLAGLAGWLLKNSNELDKTANETPEDGKRWISTHLNELNNEQIDSLINRSQSLKNN